MACACQASSNGQPVWLDWPYKLHTNSTDKSSKKDKNASADAPDRPLLLYDVSKDPKEITDLAAQQPERVAKMTAALEAWKASVENSLSGADYGTQGTGSIPMKKQKKQP